MSRQRKPESSMQKQLREYQEGEMNYLGIHKDKQTGHVTAKKEALKKKTGIMSRLFGRK